MEAIQIKKVQGTMLRTNNYILGNNKEVVIIEASVELDKMKQMVNGRKVLGIILTHGHWDHFRNIDEYIKEFKAQCFLSEHAYDKLKNNKTSFYGNRTIESQSDRKNFVFVKDGQNLNFKSYNFTVIETPGHTNGSICLKIDNYLFTGDTIFKNGYGRCDLPTGSEQDLFKSLKKLSKLNKSLKVLPGHMDETILKNEICNYI